MTESLQFVIRKNKNSSVACDVRAADSRGTEAAEESPLIAIHYVQCKGCFTNQTQNTVARN